VKAIVQDGYGSPPDVLALRDIPTPSIDDRGVLVEIHAASVNALDWHVTKGPYVLRLMMGLRTPKDPVRGVDLAGRVVAVGKRATRFKIGDEVFGGADGSFSELAATIEDRLAHKSPALTYGEAAALHVAGMTSLQGLRDKARVRAGQRVVINGAGGGVGTYAVQIAKWLGAHVTAVTRTESVGLIRSLGADDVIDHSRVDFTRGTVRYDVIFDIVGNRPFSHLRRVVAPKGTIVSVGAPQGRWIAPASRLLTAAALAPLARERVIPLISKNDAACLALLGELAHAGHIRTVVDRQFALSETADAISHVGAGRARGKVIIAVR
jgi:NADPH:quinone reductase-like Zn-dependent oxidoreductase